jgi:hypothetical protein
MHGALEVARKQFLSDYPGRDAANCRVLADEPDRHLVIVFVASDKLRPQPVLLYAVARDLQSAVKVDASEGAKYGFDPRRRK